MRILFCNKYNFPFSGTESYLFDVMRLLRSHGHEVALFSMDWGEPTGHHFQQYLTPKLDFKTHGQMPWIRARQSAHLIYSRSARKCLREAIRDFRPDIAHIRNIYHHLSPSILYELRAQNVPVLYHVNDFKMICPGNTLVSRGRACNRCRNGAFWHFWADHCYPGGGAASLVILAEAYFHKWAKTYARCVTRVLAPTQFVARQLTDSGWDAQKIEVLFHFQEPAIEATFPVGNAPILYFGRLSREKGVEDLLRAMRRNPDIPLLIAGEGPLRGELEHLARAMGLANVRFLGQLHGSELKRVIASSRFTVFPSHAGEVLGKSILESYAHSRPVIATDLGSRRELVIEGRTGLLYQYGDHEKLGSQISFLHEHPAVVEEMGRAGKQLLIERHSAAEHLARLTEIYRRTMAESVSKIDHARALKAKPKLRVAFIGGRGVVSKYSGIETFYEEVGKRLVDLGHEVTVYCRTYFTPAMEQYHGMRLVRLPTIRTKHLETLVHTCLSTLHAMVGNYDIIHYQTLGPALFSGLPRVFKKKTLVTVQGLDWQRKKWGRFAAAVLKLGEHAAARLPNKTMVVSRTLQRYFSKRCGCQPVFVPNGTEVRERSASGRLQVWDLEPGNYIMFLGRFSPEKNCDLLIRAFERIDTRAKLVLAGGSSHSDAYVEQLLAHASDRIRFLNWVSGEDLDELLTNAMLFVLPSDLEGLSLALLDAMGAGLCVLTSDVPENKELVEGVGFTFKAGDESSLSDMLERLITDPELRGKCGRAAQERVKRHYLWSTITAQIETEYLTCVGWRADRQDPRVRRAQDTLAAA